MCKHLLGQSKIHRWGRGLDAIETQEEEVWADTRGGGEGSTLADRKGSQTHADGRDPQDQGVGDGPGERPDGASPLRLHRLPWFGVTQPIQLKHVSPHPLLLEGHVEAARANGTRRGN